jgi:uncharacterized protein (DUF1501 family)
MFALDRRQFITRLGGTLALGMLPTLPRAAQAQVADDGQVLFFVFLRGAADGLSILHPAAGTSPARQKYDAWRRTATRIVNGIPLAVDGLAMHPSFGPLRAAINAGHFGFVPGVGGAQFNRSHFQQMDLVESGSATTAPLAEGVFGRAWTALRGDAEGLGALALAPRVPYAFRRANAPSALAVPDLSKVGELTSTTHTRDTDATLRTRLSRLYVPNGTCASPTRLCENGRAAVANLNDLEGLVASADLSGGLGADLGNLLAADTSRRIKMMALDLGGWDHHNQMGNDVAGGVMRDRLDGLVALLAQLYTTSRANGVFNRLTTVVVTEFGRTTFENGTQGTDHGFGSVAMVMSRGVRRPVASVGYFPAGGSGAFYDDAESVNVVPRLIEHRQVFADVLQNRLGLPAARLDAVLPGFTPSAAAPALFR